MLTVLRYLQSCRLISTLGAESIFIQPQRRAVYCMFLDAGFLRGVIILV
jgi:hypothetical protein